MRVCTYPSGVEQYERMRRLRLFADVLAVTEVEDGADNRAARRAFAGQEAAELAPDTSHSSRAPSPAPRPSPASSSTTRSSIASEAPDTAGRQHRSALVYDGDCGFCKRCAEWARRRLPQGHDVVACQELPNLDALGLSVADVTRASYWIDADGRPHRGDRGVAMALIEIGGFLDRRGSSASPATHPHPRCA